MKRSRGSAANPDFKRLKAKVGRKAPKPANVTDTSFRSASIRVASQTSGDDAVVDDASSFVSGRGKALPELLDKLRNHPAGAVRLSSAKGLKDLIQRAISAVPPAATTPAPSSSGTTTTKRRRNAAAVTATTSTSTDASTKTRPPPSDSWLSSHLSTLIPAIARCALMDADDQVRGCGLDVLKLVVTSQSMNNSSNKGSSMAPFVPLLLAHVSSALNSMDRTVRMDGAKATCLICEGLVLPPAASSTLMLSDNAASTILPALVRLLKEQSFSVITEAAAATAATAGSATTAASKGGGGVRAAASASAPDSKSRSERRRYQETVTVLRAVLGMLRGVSGTADAAPSSLTSAAATAGWKATAADSGLAAEDVWNPTSIRIVAAGAGLTAAAEKPALVRNVADLSRLCRHSSTYGGVDGRHRVHGCTTAATVSPSTIAAVVVVDLLERLRDALLDCGSGQSDDVSAPSSSGRSDVPGAEEAINLVANILPLAVDMLPPPPSSSTPEEARTRKVLSMILSSLVRFVPRQHGNGPDGVTLGANLQTQICLAIVTVDAALTGRPHGARDRLRPASAAVAESTVAAADAALPSDGEMAAVVEYTVASLRMIGSEATGAPKLNVESSSPFRSHPHSSVLQLLKILLESERPSLSAHRTRLLRSFVAAFFFCGDGADTPHPDANPSPTDASGTRDDGDLSGSAQEWQRSAAVRRAVDLARRVVFVPHQYELGTEDPAATFQDGTPTTDGIAALPSGSERCHKWAARRVLRCTPRLLVSWRGDFISDSFAALNLLHEVVRRLSLPSTCSFPQSRHGTLTSKDSKDHEDISLYVAESLTPILEARRWDGCENSGSAAIEASTFELYPEALQRVALGIFVLSGRLPGPALTALGAICSRSHQPQKHCVLSARMAATVMETVHSIRKRLSMREYLGFVLEASGSLNIRGEVQEPATEEFEPGGDARTKLPLARAMVLDRALKVACRLLVECGPASKVLSMIWPLLLIYLKPDADRSAHEDLLKARTAIAIVACLLLHSDGALILNDHRDATDVLPRSVARICRTAFAVAEEDDPRVASFLQPAVSLISISQLNLLPAIFRLSLSSDEVGSTSITPNQPSSALQLLHHLVCSAELREVVADCAGELLGIVRSWDFSETENDAVDGAVNRPSGPNQVWLGRLLLELEAAKPGGETIVDAN